MKLYLDDIRIPHSDEWTVVKNYEEFCSWITQVGLESISEIQFDHDLGDKSIIEKNGNDCAKFLVDFYLNNNYIEEDFPLVFTHSANPVGRANIEGYLNGFFKSYKIPRICKYRKIEHDFRYPK